MGIVGLGSIGLEVAQLAAAFGMRVSAIRRRVDAAAAAGRRRRVLPPERLLDLLAQSDVVVLCRAADARDPAADRPRASSIAMKRGALLDQHRRGKLIDDEAVSRRCGTAALGGAALDVFTREPLDPASPYWDLPNVIVTPHISGAMQDYWTPLVALFAENLRRFEAGEPLLNVVDKRRATERQGVGQSAVAAAMRSDAMPCGLARCCGRMINRDGHARTGFWRRWPARLPAQPAAGYGYRSSSVYPHDPNAFTQGLQYVDGSSTKAPA